MSRWWIDEPVFLGGSNPTTEELKELHKQGFRTMISLLDESEQRPNYDAGEVQAMGFHQVSIPIEDFSASTQNQLSQFLSAVNKALEKGKVVMHCQGGSGRTGTMVAGYWVKKCLSAKEAIKKVRQTNHHAVETTEQEESLHELEASIVKEK